MTDAPYPRNFFHQRVQAISQRLFWVGLAMLVLGIVAIVFPMASTLVATLMVGWALLFFGIIAFFGSLSIYGTVPFFGTLLVALLAIAASVFLLVNPAAGAAVLTFVVALLFSLQGASEIAFAYETRPLPGWVGLLISGIISVGVAIVIVAAWPGISAIFLGILLGINFLSTGLAYVLLSRVLKPTA
ncbi:MAG TPA: DUF308 domain-containing protein [Bradyrhizobium sp.]|nr:DUF308 domain-containing protein [Stellaceae bacterium]HUN98139.1 DUF308 domain-containing protein [Bradyrhizobium sp.]